MRTWLWAFICAILLASVTARAQESDPTRRPELSVAYFGEFLLHPGVLVGMSVPLAGKGTGAVHHTVVVAGNAAGYVHIRNHTGVLVDAEVGIRLTSRSRFRFEGFAGLGYLHTFLDGPVYAVDDDGVDRVVDRGRPSFMPTASVGVGWQRPRYAPFLRVQAFGQYPFNHHLLPHVALLPGVRF